MALRIKRIYEEAAGEDGLRVLVDRLWPRGLSKEKAGLDEWFKVLAPSDQLRHWFDHKAERFPEFDRRYRAELAALQEGDAEAAAAVDTLLEASRRGSVTLLYGAKNEELNQAVVLKSYLEGLSGD